MQKKTLVVAIGAALMVPGLALAQKGGGKGDKAEPDSVVELYGKVYPELVFPSSSGATAAGRATCTICLPAEGENAVIKKVEMESSNSRFGVRGHERIGKDLKAIFQLETQFLLDQNNTGFAQRDSFVGVAHKAFGTVKLGRMDTPFKEYGDDLSFLGVSSGNFTSTSNVYRHIGMGGQNNAARFHERRVNAIQYESPDIGPVDFKIQWSTNEAKTRIVDTAGNVTERDPHVLSMGGKLELGAFELLLGHEIHYDLFGISTNVPSAMRNNGATSTAHSKDKATEVALKFKTGIHTFEIDANEKKYRETGTTTTGRISSYKNNAYMFLWEARWSPTWRTAFQYIRATRGECTRVNAVCNTDGLEGEQIGLGFAYHFSRRTYLFVMGTLLKNGYSASFNNSNQQEIAPGEDMRQIAVGLHTNW
ncbi:MAG TPA: porin [Usitatibacter sp.]|nr:porin [Usitatibacter sp.]